MYFIINSKKYGKFKILIDEEDFNTVIKYTWSIHKERNNFYVLRNIYKNRKRKSLYLHTFLMNTPEGKMVDHINRNTLDNRKYNLRVCLNKENMRNRGKYSGKYSSKYKGVSYCISRNNYRARIRVDGNEIYLGSFDIEEQAAEVYNKAARKYFGNFAALNKIIKKENK